MCNHYRNRNVLVGMAFGALATWVTAASAQDPGLTVERIWGSSEFASDLVPVRWIDDSSYWATEQNGDLVDL